MRFAVNRIRECVSVSRITDCKHKRAVSLNNARDDRICGVECKAVIRRYFRGVLGICRCTVNQCVFKHIFTGKRLNIVFHLDRSVGGGNPLCGDNGILGGHRCGNFLIPACKLIACLRRLCGRSNIRAVVLCDCGNIRAAVGVECNRILVYIPLCGDNGILGGHRCGNFLIPACKLITCLRRCRGSGDIRAVVLCDCGNIRAAVGVECNRILVYIPLCGDNGILGGHRCGNFHIPACECISRLRRLCGSGNIRTEIICLFVVNLTVAHKRELVGIDGERASYGNVVCGHCRGNAVPSGEGVAGLRGRLDRGYGFTELIDLFLAVLCAVNRISKAVGISAVFKCKRKCAVGCDNTRKHRSRFIKSKARESLLFGIAYRVNGIGRTL